MRKKARVDAQGKVLIPKNIRKDIGIEPGQDVVLESRENEIIIEKFENEGADLHELAKKLSD